MYRQIGDDNQEITFSTVGGTITSWKFKGVDIFYPQETLMISGTPKLRGGMHPCFPNFGTADPKFGLPKHGPLRDREADDSDESSVSFRGTDLLGSVNRIRSEVRITITLRPNGFGYTLIARLVGPSSAPILVNGGFHPYFSTPMKTAKVILGNNLARVDAENFPAQFLSAERTTYVVIPRLGVVRLWKSGVWDDGNCRAITLWRDSSRYVCVEPRIGSGVLPRLTENGLMLHCDFDVFLD